MTTQVASTCDICGARNVSVRPSVVRWVNPAFGQYEKVDRCTDVEACKIRVQESGDAWPVEDPRT